MMTALIENNANIRDEIGMILLINLSQQYVDFFNCNWKHRNFSENQKLHVIEKFTYKRASFNNHRDETC